MHFGKKYEKEYNEEYFEMGELPSEEEYYDTEELPPVEEYYETSELPPVEEYYETSELPPVEEYYETSELPPVEEYYETSELPPVEEYYETSELPPVEEYYETSELPPVEEYYETAELPREVRYEDYEDYDAPEYADNEYSRYYADDEDEYYDEGRRHFRLFDHLTTVLGAAAVILALVVTALFMKKNLFPEGGEKSAIPTSEELAGVDGLLDDVDVIGERGLLAALDGRIGAITAAQIVEEAEKPQEYEEGNISNRIVIRMETVTVVKDLKVKFINDETGKLLPNIPFTLTVTCPDGKTVSWSDDDKDGIIYHKDIAGGEYKIHAEDLTGDKYANLNMPLDQTIKVSDKIEYKKVNVNGEVKNASQINEAAEDTTLKGAGETADTLPDTVEYVDNPRTETVYVEVGKSDIAAPKTTWMSYGSSRVVLTTSTGSDPASGTGTDPASGTTDPASGTGTDPASGSGTGTDPSSSGQTTPAPAPAVSVSAGSLEVKAGESGSISVTVSNTSENFSVSSDNTAVATASANGSNVSITGVSAGTARITVSVTGAESAVCNVTVKPKDPTISLNTAALDLKVGATGTLTVTIANADKANITATSSNTAIATVSPAGGSDSLTIKAVAAGTATITAKVGDKTATCTVTVTKNAATNLVTTTGEQLYVLVNGSYVKATSDDYFANAKVYKQVVKHYGWFTDSSGNVYYYDKNGNYVTGEQVIGGVKYNFGSNGVRASAGGTLGIDVSKWQGQINWASVKASGVSYVIIRVGYRGSTQGGLIDDSMFKTNIQGATAAGLKVGVYFVTQAIDETEAVYEASMVLDRIAGYNISYPVFLDVEASNGRGDKISAQTRTAVCQAFCRTIQNAGYTAGIYANKSWLNTKMDASALSSYKIWLALYSSSNTYAGKCDMWQYTDKGSIAGIKGNVDLNQSYLGY